MAQGYVAPKFKAKAYTCINCGVIAQMHWEDLYTSDLGRPTITPWAMCACEHCGFDSVWRGSIEYGSVANGFLAWPVQTAAPALHEDLPEVCRTDYEEARLILGSSARGAAALLRLCLEKLLKHLGLTEKDINKNIAALVQAGLDPHIQQALDVVRVTGNNAVHPLDMTPEDLASNIPVMFEMINLIVDERISRQRKMAERFASLPEGARQAIEKRDRQKQ